MPRSRAIDHCRESHAFAQVSVQGSFPPLRCTNPSRAHAAVCARARARVSALERHTKVKMRRGSLRGDRLPGLTISSF